MGVVEWRPKMQQTSHGQDEDSPLISVLDRQEGVRDAE